MTDITDEILERLDSGASTQENEIETDDDDREDGPRRFERGYNA